LAQTSMPLPVAMRDQIPEGTGATRLARSTWRSRWETGSSQSKPRLAGPKFPSGHPVATGRGRSACRLGQPGISCFVTNHSAEIFWRRRSNRKDDFLSETAMQTRPLLSADNSTVPLKVTGVMRDLRTIHSLKLTCWSPTRPSWIAWVRSPSVTGFSATTPWICDSGAWHRSRPGAGQVEANSRPLD